MKVVKTIKVRYRNQDESLSRPHNIRMMRDKDGEIFYCTMNMNKRIDPKTFIRNYPVNKIVPKSKIESVWKPIRVKFVNVGIDIETGEERVKYSRPITIYEVTTTTERDGEVIEVIEYAPFGERHIATRIDKDEILFEWKKGPTPSPRSLKLNRTYSAKDVTNLRKHLGGTKKITADRAREILNKYKNISTAEIMLEDIINNVREIKKKSQKDVIHMGKYTYAKISEIKRHSRGITAKPGSRRYRKLFKKGKINKEGYSRDREAIRIRMRDEELFVKLPLGTTNGLSPESERLKQKQKRHEQKHSTKVNSKPIVGNLPIEEAVAESQS